MSEAAYLQVKDAIARELHLGIVRENPGLMGALTWHYPVRIVDGEIEMRDSDCGLAKPSWTITIDEWQRLVAAVGLFTQVGPWSFVLADDPAADCIRHCEHSPMAAGRELYRLRQARRELYRPRQAHDEYVYGFAPNGKQQEKRDE